MRVRAAAGAERAATAAAAVAAVHGAADADTIQHCLQLKSVLLL